MRHETERRRRFTRRAFCVGAGQTVIFASLATRLFHLQVRESDQYKLLADENRIDQRPLAPARGLIFDRHGMLLAHNQPVYRVIIVPEQAGPLANTLKGLGRLIALSPDRVEQVLAQAKSRPGFMPILVEENLAWWEVARIAIHAPDLPGVALESGLVRAYPAREAAAHVLGYVAAPAKSELSGDPLLTLPGFQIGKKGIEKAYDERLKGAAGLAQVEVNALGREIRELKRVEGRPGDDLRLTVDLELQRFVHDRLAEATSASAVVLDVEQGDVLALSSFPSFDPEPFSAGISRRAWQALIGHPQSPLLNKAIGGLYPPGSVFKMIVALAALESNLIRFDHKVRCSGHVIAGRRAFHCWKRGGHGVIDPLEAIAQSCDVFFYEAARTIGVDAIAAMARQFGLGAPVGIDIPGERSGLIPDRAWKQANLGTPWQPGETLVVGIGQGYVQTTPLQLAAMTAAIARGGRALRPRLIAGREIGAEWREPAVSAASLQLVQAGMAAVVNGPTGTARGAQLGQGFPKIAGKTGTAQVRRIGAAERRRGVRKNEDKPWEERDHALFVAYAPLERPRFSIAVVIEHGGSGSQAAAPVARDIMRRLFELEARRHPPKIASPAPPAQPTT